MMVGGGGGGCEGEVTGRAVAGRTARARGAHPTSMTLGERRNVPVAFELDERPLVAVHLQQHRVSNVHGGRVLLLGTRGRRWRARKSAKLRHRSMMRRWMLPAMRCDASVCPAGDDCAEWIEIHVRAPRECRASSSAPGSSSRLLSMCAKLLPLSSPPALFTLKRTHARRRRLPLDGYRRAHAEAPRVPRVDSPDRHPDTRRLARPDGRART